MNVNFEYARTLAGEGSILLLLGLVPYVGWVLGIVGIILLVKAMKEFSYYYEDEKIYENSLTGVKYYVIALIAAAIAIVGMTVGAASATDLFVSEFVFTGGFAAGLITFIGGLVVAFVFYVLAASNLRKTFDTLATKSGESYLATAGMLLWVGSILTIVAIGLLLIFVAWIFATIGFFGMKSKQHQQYVPYQNDYMTPPPQPPVQV
jgi:uncharacterized membrane protein